MHATLNPHGCVRSAHRLLLWADCLLPDDVVTAARTWLADGLVDDAVAAVAFAVLSEGITAPDDLAGLLTDALHRAGAAPDAVPVDGAGTLPDLQYHPTGPGGSDLPGSALDLTDARPHGSGLDPVDREAVDLVRQLRDATAVWRSWRRPPRPTWGSRGYLVRLADAAPAVDPLTAAYRLPEVTGWFQQRLAGPLVRVYRHEDELPLHLRMALDHAALLWTRPAPVRLRVAHDRPGGVRPSPVQRDYLRAGTPVLIDLAYDGPWPDPARPPMVRTDGTWLWRDTARRIERALAGHIARVAGPPPPVDETTLRRAVIALGGP
ncbi:hypothetical protein [Virgisporangium ochraceum]|uniref:Uncharacterized protein n=1 Tax=Virgisporangium ochraceum TaxID=65505 RepID=A0A8J4ED38_9ACTN|nr:hypothetical protein [Virgisporangium ochraceum]GIJ71110.1 hypothetical protein Voc01_060270 [Virgisporangium ochraceum]